MGDIKGTVYISRSTVSNSTINNRNTQSGVKIPSEMLTHLRTLASACGKNGESSQVEELKLALEEGRKADAQRLWPRLRAFLQDFANVSQIVSAVDLLTRYLTWRRWKSQIERSTLITKY